MIIEQLTVDLPVLLIRIMIVSFFSIGYIQVFQRLWDSVFDQPKAQSWQWWGRRILLTIMTVAMGTLVHLDAMLFIHNDSSIIYHNWALFMLILPLLFGGFSKLEVLIQYVAILDIWYMHHAPNLFEPHVFTALIVFFGATIALKVFRNQVMQRWQIGAVGSVFVACLFWLTAPTRSMGMHVTTAWAIQAVILFTLMVSFVLGYWIRQHREDLRNRELERLADYEKAIEQNSYADHQEELQALFKEAHTSNTDLSFVTFDLDDMKTINDRFGRLAGNAVLSGVAALMKQRLSTFGVQYQLFMTSGEEYNVVFPNQKAANILTIVEACWQGIRKSEFSYEDYNITVTVSAGVTEIHPEDKSINSLYKRSDDALLHSKKYGRDAITLNGKVVSGRHRAEVNLANYCYFSQGIHEISSPDLPLSYHELLLRMYDSIQQRWILPDYFEIPVWMQVTLLKEFMSHTEVQNFNLNLTAAQFQDMEVAKVLTQFAESPEGPQRLTVEITDLTDSQTTRRISALYRSANIKIMIDDVGSDNSFELVRGALPYVNGMKFAMQNLRKTTSEDELIERISFWYQIAQENELDFILEGVETEAELKTAQDFGIRYVQGYVFGKPAPATSETP